MYSPNSISNTFHMNTDAFAVCFVCLAQSAQKTILVAPAPVEEANQDSGCLVLSTTISGEKGQGSFDTRGHRSIDVQSGSVKHKRTVEKCLKGEMCENM